MSSSTSLAQSVDTRVWVVRAGRRSSAHKLFIEHGLVALGAQGLGDLTSLLPTTRTRNDFIDLVRRSRPREHPSSLGRVSGTFFKFVESASQGDIVVYPSTSVDQSINIGVLNGPYFFNSADSLFPHQRHVEWLTKIDRYHLPSDALSELGSFHAFYQMQRTSHVIVEVVAALSPERFLHEGGVLSERKAP